MGRQNGENDFDFLVLWPDLRSLIIYHTFYTSVTKHILLLIIYIYSKKYHKLKNKVTDEATQSGPPIMGVCKRKTKCRRCTTLLNLAFFSRNPTNYKCVQ